MNALSKSLLSLCVAASLLACGPADELSPGEVTLEDAEETSEVEASDDLGEASQAVHVGYKVGAWKTWAQCTVSFGSTTVKGNPSTQGSNPVTAAASVVQVTGNRRYKVQVRSKHRLLTGYRYGAWDGRFSTVGCKDGNNCLSKYTGCRVAVQDDS